MGNPFAGEVEITLDGVPHCARLTLGALAEMEAALPEAVRAGGLMGLAARFEAGAFSGGDVLALIVAGLRGGGWQGRAGDLLAVDIAGGPLAAAGAAAQLLTRAFLLPEEA